MTHSSGYLKWVKSHWKVVVTALQNSYWGSRAYNEERQGKNLWGCRGKKNLKGVLTHSSKCFLDPLDFTSHRVEVAGENQVHKENKRFLAVTTCATNAEWLMTKAFSSEMCTIRSLVPTSYLSPQGLKEADTKHRRHPTFLDGICTLCGWPVISLIEWFRLEKTSKIIKSNH